MYKILFDKDPKCGSQGVDFTYYNLNSVYLILYIIKNQVFIVLVYPIRETIASDFLDYEK